MSGEVKNQPPGLALVAPCREGLLADFTLPSSLQSGNFGQTAGRRRQIAKGIVSGDDATKTPVHIHHGEAPDSFKFHDLDRLVKARIDFYGDDLRCHDITHGELVNGSLLGNDLDDDISISHDSRGIGPAVVLSHYDH